MLQAAMLRFIVILGGLLIVAIVAAFVAQSSLPLGQADVVSDAETALGLELTVPPKALVDITFTDAEGALVRLEDKRGKLVLVNFWATWCPPCVREMPSLDRLQAELGGPGFEVVAMSEDREINAIGPFYERYGLTALAGYHDPYSRLVRRLEVPGLPTTILIDQAGNELGRVVGPAEWDSPEALALMRHYMTDPVQSADAE